MDRRSFLKTIAFALVSGFITRDKAYALDGTHSLFCAVVNVADKNGNVTQSGHIMAADGLACFGPKGTGISDQYIHVYDGWNSHVFIRKNHSAYTNKFGVYFTK